MLEGLESLHSVLADFWGHCSFAGYCIFAFAKDSGSTWI